MSTLIMSESTSAARARSCAGASDGASMTMPFAAMSM
jgi:hypothetical protein